MNAFLFVCGKVAELLVFLNSSSARNNRFVRIQPVHSEGESSVFVFILTHTTTPTPRHIPWNVMLFRILSAILV